MTIPCYVSGKGMYATDRTRQFKVAVMETLGLCRKFSFEVIWGMLSPDDPG